MMMKTHSRPLRSFLPLAAAALLLLSACSDREPRATDDLALMREVMRAVHGDYVRDVNDQKLVQDAVKGMVSELDPHSAYMDPKEFRDFRADTRGEFGGIGAELTRDGGRVKVIAPIDDTPAARAGIRPADIIQRVDGEPIEGLDLSAVVDRIRGPIGSTVALTLVRGNGAPFDVSLKRSLVRVAAVKSKLEPGRIGYARVSIFNENTQEQLAAAIARMEKETGGRLAGFVLDLRNDPGGLLDQAVAVAGDFIDGGTIVTTRGRDGKVTRSFEAESHGDRLKGAPMVVLVNGASASAAEIVAGALQDHGRATLVGTPTFGKGSVQTILPLSHGGALRLTTDLYYTPSGRSIQAQGIQPDLVVAPPANEQVAGAQLTREADLRDAIKPPGTESATERNRRIVGSNGIIDPTILGTDKDHQLAVALDTLRKHAVSKNGRGG